MKYLIYYFIIFLLICWFFSGCRGTTEPDTFKIYEAGRYLAMMNIDGRNKTILTNKPGRNSFPVFSPDGSKIAYWNRSGGNSDIYLVNIDGSEQKNLTNHPTNFSHSPSGFEHIVFSPDGLKIVFISDRDGNSEIYSMNIDGSDQTNLTNNPAHDVFPSFTPDGSKIVFRSTRNGSDEIYIMNTDGSELRNLTNTQTDEMKPVISPDGTKIAYTSHNGNNNISIMNIDGSGKTVLSSGDSPAFTPDGTKIVFTIGNPSDIYIMNIDGTEKTNLTNTTEWSGDFVVSPDGMKIAYRKDIEGEVYIYIMNIDGTDNKLLIGPAAFSPAFSPNGSKIAFMIDLFIN